MMETKFERGGVLPQLKKSKSSKEYFGLQNVPKEKSKQKHDSEKKKSKNEEMRSATPLTIHTLVPDMLLMGIVKAVYPTHLLLNLPGRLVGRVPITHISKSYSSLVKNSLTNDDSDEEDQTVSTLPEMFSKGQCLYVKVLNKSFGEKQEILLSVLPSDINSELSSSILAKGNLIMCAVEDVEDHGYIMECGIEGMKAFLPKKNAKSELKVGELVLCKVQKIKSDSNAMTLVAFKRDESAKIDTDDVPNLKTILPGSIVEFNIVRNMKNGLEGLLFDGSVQAYANEMHIPVNLSKNSIGKAVKARIIFTMPLSNQIFVTLNLNESERKNDIKFGTLVANANVIKQTTAGVMFNLKENRKGFLPRKTIIKSLKNNFDIDTALMKFSPNSAHNIRVMDYNEIEDCYLCTNEENLLREKYFSTYDLKIGQIVRGKVVEKLTNGFQLSIGNVRAFLTGMFFRKVKLNVGQEIDMRVVEIDHEMKLIQVTNHVKFLKDSCKILSNKSNLKAGNSFTGIVIKDGSKSYCILFFNHFKGLLHKTPETEADVIAIGGLKEGSVTDFQVTSVKGNKINLKISKGNSTDRLGKIFTCKVTAKLPSSLQIYIDELKEYGRVNVEFLSDFSSLREPIFAAIKENLQFKVVGLTNNLYSRRDLDYYSNALSKKDFHQVEAGDVLRCYVKNIDDENVELECPLANFNQSIRLNRNIFNNADELFISSGDVVYVSVIKKDKNSLFVTPELSTVWKSDSDALELVENYLRDINFLLQRAKENKKPFGKFKIGSRESGTVKDIIGNNLLIELENGVLAQATVDNCIYKIGAEIKDAVIVWMDPINEMVFVTLKDNCKNEINTSQAVDEKLVNPKKHKARVVYFNDYVTVCTIRKANQPLIYTASKHHYNDFSTINFRALGNATSKLMIKRVTDDNSALLGTFVEDTKMFQKLEKLKDKLEVKIAKRKHTESISSDVSNEGFKRPKVILDDSESD